MRYSKQTGFIHYNPHSNDHDTIPIFENACYILELLQTKTAQNLHAAKFLLTRLLKFQTKSGNFPQYLHEYPDCYNGLTAFKLLTPFHLIQRDFYAILGSTDLKKSIKKLHTFCQNNLDRSFVTSEHHSLFAATQNQPITWESNSAAGWSILLQAHTLAPDPSCLKNLSKHWNSRHNTFIGVNESFEKLIPKPTLLDLFLNKTFENHPINLQQSLVTPIEIKGSAPDLVTNTTNKKSLQTIRYLLPNRELVCEDTQHNLTVCDKTFDFTYPQEIGKDEFELNFYITQQPCTRFSSSTFALDEPVKIGDLTLTFSLQEGEGRFLGHISRANRPSQTANRRENRFDTYDYRIALRTIAREGLATIRVSVV